MLAAPTSQLGCQRVVRELTDNQEQSGPTEGLQLGASWAGDCKDAWEEADAWDCGHRGWWSAISPGTGSACCALSSAGSMPEGSFCAEKVGGLKRSCGLRTNVSESLSPWRSSSCSLCCLRGRACAEALSPHPAHASEGLSSSPPVRLQVNVN